MEGVPYGACEPAEPPAVDPPPRRLLRRSWLWRASLLCTLAVSSSALGRRALAQRSAAMALSPAALLRDGAPTGGLSLRVSNDAYGEWRGAEYYPWRFVAEPYRTTIFRVENASAAHSYAWSVRHVHGTGRCPRLADEETPVTSLAQAHAEMRAVFTRAAGTYHVTVVESTPSGAESRRAAEPIECKYVRRELRQLTQHDLDAYLSATAAIHRLTMDEGRRQYGTKFRNFEYFTAKHLDRRSLLECTPYHKGDVFLTAHAAFNMEFEQALQSIDPAIASPFWVRFARARRTACMP